MLSRWFQLLKAESAKEFGYVKVYWFNYLFGNLNVFFMFFGLFLAFGGRDKTQADMLTFLFGLMYWYFGVHSIDGVAYIVEEEIEQGTLEQLLITKTPFALSLFFRIIAQILFDAFKGVFVFLICMMAFGIPFRLIGSWNFVISLVIFFIGLIAMYGIGYMVAGFSLRFKHAYSIAALSSSLILFFSGTTIALEQFPAAVQYVIQLFPMTWSMRMIAQQLVGSMEGILQMGLVLAAELVFWLAAGILFLNRCVIKVFKLGATACY